MDSSQSLNYFVTFCVERRLPVLANDKAFGAITQTLQQLRRWNAVAGVVMPDHMHLIVAPAQDRSLTISDFSTGFKRLIRKSLPRQYWQWQAGCFDRLLRSDENLHNKWLYIEQNPVRAGLVTDVSEWPYYFGSIAARRSVGEPVSLPGSRIGKLTASPTKEEMREAGSFPYRGMR